MNQEETNKLLKLYEQGRTSSEQESDLLKILGESKAEKNLWFNFLRKQKKNTPKNLEEQIWSAIQLREKKKSRYIIRAISIAASIALLISVLWITNPLKPKEMSYEEKAAVLKEALAMISLTDEAENNKEIIYEDDLLIIYSEK